MARGAKRKKDFNRETDKIRNFELIIYPDSESYDYQKVLQLLQEKFEKWAYITHDRDTDNTGELKKAHIHFYGSRSSPVLIRTISNAIDLPANYINPVFDWNAAIQYATHINEPDKYLYRPSDITSNFDHQKLFKNQRDDAEDAEAIFDFICDTRCTNTEQLLRWVFANGHWAAYRRAAGVWRDLIADNRERVRIKYQISSDVNLDSQLAANRAIFVETDEVSPFEQMEL